MPGNRIEIIPTTGNNAWDNEGNQRGYTYNTVSGQLSILDIYEECPWWDWFCWGSKPFNPYDVADDGTMVGAIGTASGAGAMIVSELTGALRLVDFLKGQGVTNANDLGIASTANKISSNGRHITGWTAVDGYFGSFKLTLDQLCVCRNGRTQQVGYPAGVASQLNKGATLGMCDADLPKISGLLFSTHRFHALILAMAKAVVAQCAPNPQ